MDENVKSLYWNSATNEERGKLPCDVTAAFLMWAGTRGGARAAADYIAKSPLSLGPLFVLSLVEC